MEPQTMVIIHYVLLLITVPGLIQAVLHDKVYFAIFHSFTIGINFTVISLYVMNRLH